MQQLEPTYLRYVYDGLSKGSISANNPTSLPIGFIGLFEYEFPSSMPLVERMSVLNKLAMWSLLKGPVSINMVAEVLNEHPDNTKALVDTYSKWFNSPEPGKYVLYHDRLRTYLLQKLSDHEVQNLNETLIGYLENALNSQGLKEAESYALEHLSTHMLIESQMGNNYERLHEFVNHEDLWKRQITISNEYKWSQRTVQYGIKEGARRHNEINTLSSTVNSVKLIQEEQNSAQQILNLLNEGDYQTALERANFFKGKDLMKIYLLMLYELVLGQCKNKVYSKDTARIILDNIDQLNFKIRFNSDKILFNYPKRTLLDIHIKLKLYWIDDTKLLQHLSFSFNSIDTLLKNGEIQIQELLKYDLFNLIKNRYLNLDVVSILFERFDINNSVFLKNIENIVRNSVSNLRDEFLFLLESLIRNFDFYKESNNNNYDLSFNEFFGGLVGVVTSNNLINWLKHEKLDRIILYQFKKICEEHPYYTNNYAELLVYLDRREDAIALLNLRLAKATSDNNYVESHNDSCKEIATIFFRKGKTVDAVYFLDKIQENIRAPKDIICSKAYIEFCLHLIKKKIPISYINFIEKINEVCYTVEELDVQPKRKKNIRYYYWNIDLHIGMFNIYVLAKQNSQAIKHIQFALELNDLICTKFCTDIENNQFAFRSKYQTLGRVCKNLHNNGFKEKSKKIVDDFVKNVISLNSKIFISKAIDHMYSNMLGLYVNEFLILNKKYPLNGMESMGKVAKYKYYREFDDFVDIHNYVNRPADINEHFFGDKSQYLEIILDRNLKDYDFWNSRTFQSYYKYYTSNSKEIIKITNENIYKRHLNSLNFFNSPENINSFIIKSLKVERIKSEKIDSILSKKINKKEEISKSLIQSQKETVNLKEKSNTDDELNILFNYLNELEEKISNGTCEFNDVKNVLDERKKLLLENKEKINNHLIPTLVKSQLLYFNFILSLIKDIKDLHLRSKNYFHFALFLLEKHSFSDDKKYGWQFSDHDVITIYDKDENDGSSILLNNSNEARKILVLACKDIFDIFKLNYHQNDDVFFNLISYLEELFTLNAIKDVISLAKEYKELLEFIDTSDKDIFLTRAPITRIEMPWDYIHEVYEFIFKRLIDIDRREDAFEIANLMIEKNEIANMYIYYINKLVDQDLLVDALKEIPKIHNLIINSDPLPIDNSIWPVKGYSFLKLADFFIKISDLSKAEKYLDYALLEVFPQNKELSLELYELDEFGNTDFSTHFNEENKFEFLYEAIKLYLKLSNLEKCMELFHLINPIAHKYICGRKSRLIDMQGYTIYFYKDALLEISKYLYKIDFIKSFLIIHQDQNLELKEKKIFYNSFFFKSDLEKCFLILSSYIDKDLDSFVNPISSSFIQKKDINTEYMYLSKFPQFKKELSNILLAKSFEYLTSKTKPDEEKLNLLSQVIDIDKWRNISAY